MKLLRTLWAFVRRDLQQELSYRFAFVGTIGGVMFRSLLFFFLSSFVGEIAHPFWGDNGGDYFSFVILGIAMGGYFSTGLTSFAQALRQAQISGTLEATLMTPLPVWQLIVGSALWSYLLTSFRVMVYLLFGAIFLSLDLSRANVAAALLILLLSVLSFASIGVMVAALIMVIKRGDPLTAVLANSANLLGGVFYPVAILPTGLQWLAACLPLTYALRGLRLAVLEGATWTAVAPDLLALALFCLLLGPLSLWLFATAVDYARNQGSLTHY